MEDKRKLTRSESDRNKYLNRNWSILLPYHVFSSYNPRSVELDDLSLQDAVLRCQGQRPRGSCPKTRSSGHDIQSVAQRVGLRAFMLILLLAGVSSCTPNTLLTGVNYLKGQDPVLALPDEEYPPWLWKLLEPKVLVDDGPGGKAEKVRLRKENRQRIRDSNMLKTQ